ncbi:hypothetical protein C7B80_10190 [Cyanosarcina cf. burmensis CCALA 770]|nr:hypothetical protein C7B80_10190 [Cyanosarcina cf. burmensis CCALA 770]
MARKAIHGQRKKDVTVTLTPESIQALDVRAKALGMSRSELIEQIARTPLFFAPEHQTLGKLSTN